MAKFRRQHVNRSTLQLATEGLPSRQKAASSPLLLSNSTTTYFQKWPSREITSKSLSFGASLAHGARYVGALICHSHPQTHFNSTDPNQAPNSMGKIRIFVVLNKAQEWQESEFTSQVTVFMSMEEKCLQAVTTRRCGRHSRVDVDWTWHTKQRCCLQPWQRTPSALVAHRQCSPFRLLLPRCYIWSRFEAAVVISTAARRYLARDSVHGKRLQFII